MEAANLGKLEEVERLASEGTSVNATDAEKRSALMFAAFGGASAGSPFRA